MPGGHKSGTAGVYTKPVHRRRKVCGFNPSNSAAPNGPSTRPGHLRNAASTPAPAAEAPPPRRDTACRHPRAVAQAYLESLYAPEAQETVARNHCRPIDKATAAKYVKQFPALNRVTIEQAFGGWGKAQATHFAERGIHCPA